MNRRYLLTPVLVACLLVASVLAVCPSCSTIPANQAVDAVTAAETALAVAETAVTIQSVNGKISPSTYAQLQLLDNVAFNYLTAAQVAAASGKDLDAQEQLKLFNDALRAFNAAYAAARIPTTQPH